MSISADIRVEKFLPDGSRKLDYHGEVLARSDAAVLLKARFTHPDMQFFGLDILNGDVFYELHYNDRFYNIFAIHAGDASEAKAWYANLTRPATIAADSVSFIDLALDVLAFPAPGAMLVLDEDEYHALGLLPAEQAQVQSALKAVLPIMERLRTRTISLSDLFLETTL